MLFLQFLIKKISLSGSLLVPELLEYRETHLPVSASPTGVAGIKCKISFYFKNKNTVKKNSQFQHLRTCFVLL